ncbi:MAG: FtsX-like permease family protein [Spirochaetaceae bacterium]|jgi:putative ABC transport system permease protein|nr:FtsX-like permease family protein [Spirochaetaceae bacterium]
MRYGGGFAVLITIAYRNIWRNMRRTIFCIAAAAVAVFFMVFMQAWMAGMMNNIEEVVQVFETGQVSVVSSRFESEKEYYPVQFPLEDDTGAPVPASRLESLILGIDGVRAVLPRVMAYATLQDSTVKHALLWGIRTEEELALHNFNLISRGSGLVEGRYPAPGARECAIGSRMAEKAGFKIGDRIPLKTVSAQFSDKMWNPVITGIFRFDYLKYDEDVIITDLEDLSRLLVLGEGVQQLFIYTEKNSQSRAVSGVLKTLLGEGAVVKDWTDNYFVSVMRQSMILYAVVYLIFLIVASFLIINTMVMIIHERIKEIGMMGSLGMTRREIVLVFFLESVFLSVLGSLAGCAAGGIATFVFSFFPLDFTALTGGGFKEFPMAGTLVVSFDPRILMQGFIFGVVTASLCALIPSLKSAFVEPVEALRR